MVDGKIGLNGWNINLQGSEMRKSNFLVIAFVAITCFSATAAQKKGVNSDTIQAPTAISLQPFISSGLSSPVFMTSARDKSNRLFIVQQGGIIRVVPAGSSAPNSAPFLNITNRVLSGGERGLLGLAFHPLYNRNRRFFVYYTRQTDGAIQVAEYHASASNPDVADLTEKIIITIPHPTNNNHNGGTVAFGPKGYLYIGTGDGGSANDPPNNSQNINVLLGKIIRLDINNIPVGASYGIPSDNPYVGIAGADEIFALGVRNPYRFSFDRFNPTAPGRPVWNPGILWVADVGQGATEEVDNVTLGGNYGWRAYEGTNCTNLNPTQCAGGSAPFLTFRRSSNMATLVDGVRSLEDTFIVAPREICPRAATFMQTTVQGRSFYGMAEPRRSY